MELVVYVSGFVALAMVWLLVRVLAGSWIPRQLVEGADGRPSTSKLQWFLWTVVVVFSYMAVYAARVQKGHFEVITEIPANILIAMGLSLGTMTAAKGITVQYVAKGKVVKDKVDPKRDTKDAGLSSVVRDDDKYLDLSKIQMMAWTLVAIGVYLIRVVHEIGLDLPALPDIDAALMVLMGLGQGAYLGKKLVSTTAPRLNGLSPGSGKPGTEITITGASFGEKQNGSQITIDNNPYHPDPAPAWEDAQIKFTIPAKTLDNKEWSPGQRTQIGIIVSAQDSSNTLPFTVTAE